MEIIISAWWHWALVIASFTLVAFFGFIAAAILSAGSRSDLECEIIRLKDQLIWAKAKAEAQWKYKKIEVGGGKRSITTVCPLDGSVESKQFVELIKEAEDNATADDLPVSGGGASDIYEVAYLPTYVESDDAAGDDVKMSWANNTRGDVQ